jgi:hypothetical protein
MAEVTFSGKLAAESVGTRALVICGPGPAAASFMIARSADVKMVDILSNPEIDGLADEPRAQPR